MLTVILFFLLVMFLLYAIPALTGRFFGEWLEDKAKREEAVGQGAGKAEGPTDPEQRKLFWILTDNYARIENDGNRQAVEAYAEAIQKLKRNEHVDPYAARYIVSQLEGTEKAVRKIKRLEKKTMK